MWADAARHFELDTKSLHQVRPSMQKFAVRTHEQFVTEAVPLRALYGLSSTNRDVLDVRSAENTAAFGLVLNSTYRRTFLRGLGMQAIHFALATKVASTVPVKRMRRPNAGFTVARVADIIELDLAGEYTEPEEGEETSVADFVAARAAAASAGKAKKG